MLIPHSFAWTRLGPSVLVCCHVAITWQQCLLSAIKWIWKGGMHRTSSQLQQLTYNIKLNYNFLVSHLEASPFDLRLHHNPLTVVGSLWTQSTTTLLLLLLTSQLVCWINELRSDNRIRRVSYLVDPHGKCHRTKYIVQEEIRKCHLHCFLQSLPRWCRWYLEGAKTIQNLPPSSSRA